MCSPRSSQNSPRSASRSGVRDRRRHGNWPVLRAAGALRIMSAFFGDASLVNRVVAELRSSGDFTLGAPTNHPGGWHAYAAIFQSVECTDQFNFGRPLSAAASRLLYGGGCRPRPRAWQSRSGHEFWLAQPWRRARRRRVPADGMAGDGESGARAIPDPESSGDQPISSGKTIRHGACTAASRHYADCLCRSGSCNKLIKDLSDWGLPGDPPILTEHVDAQFGWMLEAHPDPAEWRARYPDDSGLDIDAALRKIHQ